MMYAVVAGSDTARASAQISDFSIPDADHEAESVDELVISIWGPGVQWSGLPEAPNEGELRVYVESPDGDMSEYDSMTCTEGDPTTGQCRWSGDDANSATAERFYVDLLSGDWSSDHFSPDPGEEVSHTIDVRLEADVTWSDGSVSASDSTSTTISVTNPQEATETNSTETDSTDTNSTTTETADPEASVSVDSAEVLIDGESYS